MFHGVGTNKRLSWSEYRLSGITGGGSLKLSQAKAKKLMDECAMSHVSDWDEATTVMSSDETNNTPIKTHKGQFYQPMSNIFKIQKLLLNKNLKFWGFNRKDVAFEPTFPQEKSVQKADDYEHI
jgi:hypothetical protein